MSYQEKAVGGQIYLVFGLGLLLVYLCLAGQYESWIAPLSVILAVPLALSGPALALGPAGAGKQPLHPDRPGAADRAVGQERDPDRRGGARPTAPRGPGDLAAAVEAARTRFRPIVMTSFAFILGVVPLVTVYRRRRGGAHLARVERADRDDRVHLLRRVVRAVVLRGAAGVGGTHAGQHPGGAGERRGGLVSSSLASPQPDLCHCEPLSLRGAKRTKQSPRGAQVHSRAPRGDCFVRFAPRNDKRGA